MNQPKDIKLNIKKPCKENWEDFQKLNHTAGYCSQCEKSVVDFSRMSDQELIQYLQTASGKVCGRFKKEQLKEYHLIDTKPNFGFHHLRKSLVALAFLILAKPSVATTSALPKADTYIHENDSSNVSEPKADGIKVSGVVTDGEIGEALPGASVILKGSDKGTTTNLDGEFSFPEELKKGDVLQFMFIGFATKELKIRENMDVRLEIELEMDHMQLGEVSIDYLYTGRNPKTSFWNKIAAWF